MYYCATHQVAFETLRQWSGHCLHAHPGEPRPKAEDVFVEQAPEGARVAPAPSSRGSPAHPSPSRPVQTPDGSVSPRTPPVPPVAAFESEEEEHLDQLLDGINIPSAQRQTIVKGWRSFPVLHQHPANLENYILNVVGPKFRGSVPLVVHAMYPGAEPEPAGSQYMYGSGPASYGRPAPMGWNGSQPAYQYPGEMGPPGYRYFPPGAEAPPQVSALQKQVDGILGVLQTERAERAQEKAEQREKDREVAWQSQLNGVVSRVDATFKEVAELVKGLGDQVQRGRGDAEATQAQKLLEEVSDLKSTIANDREAHLQETVETLGKELAGVRQKLDTEPTGRTTEDLISTGLPLVVSQLRDMGSAVTTELKGIRMQAADGKLPVLAPPGGPNAGRSGGATSQVAMAQQIAGAHALEDEILSAVSGRPGS